MMFKARAGSNLGPAESSKAQPACRLIRKFNNFDTKTNAACRCSPCHMTYCSFELLSVSYGATYHGSAAMK